MRRFEMEVMIFCNFCFLFVSVVILNNGRMVGVIFYFECLFGFWRVVLVVCFFLKDWCFYYCSFLKFVVFRIEFYLLFYLWMLIMFNKGYFVMVIYVIGKEWFFCIVLWYYKFNLKLCGGDWWVLWYVVCFLLYLWLKI